MAREFGLIMKSGDHRRFRDCRDQVIFDRRDCDARPSTIQAAFAEELVGLENRDGFVRQDSNLDLSFLNVKYRVRDIALLQTRAGSCEILRSLSPHPQRRERVWDRTSSWLTSPKAPSLARPISPTIFS
jgi:hypothetical protein